MDWLEDRAIKIKNIIIGKSLAFSLFVYVFLGAIGAAILSMFTDNIINICTPYATIINMQGNVIQNILKIFLLFSLFHVSMGGILNYIGFIALAIFAGMITGGVPGGGVVSNTILVNILNFPSSALPILITIEWILDAPATVFNVLSDSSTLPLVDKIVKRK